MIENGVSQRERLDKLNKIARKHLKLLIRDKTVKYIESIDKLAQ